MLFQVEKVFDFLTRIGVSEAVCHSFRREKVSKFGKGRFITRYLTVLMSQFSLFEETFLKRKKNQQQQPT